MNVPYILLGLGMFAIGWVVAWKLNCYEAYHEGYRAAMRELVPKPSHSTTVAPEDTQLIEPVRFRYRGRSEGTRALDNAGWAQIDVEARGVGAVSAAG